MKVLYKNAKVKAYCTNMKDAGKLLGGAKSLIISLNSRINALKQAKNLHDIIVQPQFHFHNLIDNGKKNLKGLFAIDLKSRADRWRIILLPLKDDEMPFEKCNIDEICKSVKIIEITEVSNHYE